MNLQTRLEKILLQIARIGGDARPFLFNSPADEQDVKVIEKELGYQLPNDFKNLLLAVCSKCEFNWFLPENIELPYVLRETFRGQLQWGMDTLLPFEEARKNWVSEVFPNPEDEYDKVWHNKLVFQEIGNGDWLSIDLSIELYGKIIYLSHDDGEGHGYVMANSFTELLESWAALGCVGGEDWQWLPFCKDKYSGIDPYCENALLLKQTLGLRPSNSV